MFTKETIENYFFNYKQVHLFLSMVSVAAIVAAAIFYWGVKKDFSKGIAVSFVSLAFAFGTYGYFNYNTADRLRKINTYNYDLHPEYLKAKELPRIAKLKKNILIIGILNTLLLIVSIYFGYYYLKKVKYLYGIFTGMCIMSLFALILCFAISASASKYEDGIANITSKIILKENTSPL